MVDVVALAAQLMAFDSVTGREGPVAAFVAQWLETRGWRVTRQPVSEDRVNVWATRGGGGVTFSTHLDTVPPHVAPRVEGGRLHGRGACDAKGIAAAMLAAATRLAAGGEDRVDLLFVVGEERGSDGARAANALPATSRFLVNGEPTEGALALGAKGSLRVTVCTEGREAHSAYPALGASAIEAMLAVLGDLRDARWPREAALGDTTLNIGRIAGGTAPNVVAGACEAELLFRLVGPAQAVRARIEACVAGRARITYGLCIPAQRFHVVPGFPVTTVAYTSDVPLLDRWGIPLLYGPGSIHVAHTPDECVDVDALHAAVDGYATLATTLLASHA